MSFQAANRIAIRHGYDEDSDEDECILDTEWWMCLGKGLGWNNNMIQQQHATTDEAPPKLILIQHFGWAFYQLLCIEQLQEGRDLDDFFKELIEAKTPTLKQNDGGSLIIEDNVQLPRMATPCASCGPGTSFAHVAIRSGENQRGVCRAAP